MHRDTLSDADDNSRWARVTSVVVSLAGGKNDRTRDTFQS